MVREDPWDVGWWRYRVPGLGQVDWRAVVETTARVDAERDAFRIRARVRAWEGDTLLHEREWDESVPRDHA